MLVKIVNCFNDFFIMFETIKIFKIYIIFVENTNLKIIN